MSLTIEDVRKVAKLSMLELAPEKEAQTLAHLSNLFSLIDQMQSVDTSGVLPLSHPIAMVQEAQQRLRTDEVTETNQREENMANAPQKESGLFLVPKVIE